MGLNDCLLFCSGHDSNSSLLGYKDCEKGIDASLVNYVVSPVLADGAAHHFVAPFEGAICSRIARAASGKMMSGPVLCIP